MHVSRCRCRGSHLQRPAQAFRLHPPCRRSAGAVSHAVSPLAHVFPFAPLLIILQRYRVTFAYCEHAVCQTGDLWSPSSIVVTPSPLLIAWLHLRYGPYQFTSRAQFRAPKLLQSGFTLFTSSYTNTHLECHIPPGRAGGNKFVSRRPDTVGLPPAS